MNIALIGFGNMGKEIFNLVQNDARFKIVSISYGNNSNKLDLSEIKKADVAIDFTSADIVIENIQKVASLHIPMVIGTTGWYEKKEKVKSEVEKNNIGLVYGQNFSIGANIFFNIISYSSALVRKFPMYDTYGLEIHHSGKKDSPSGTAQKLTSIIMENNPSKNSMQVKKMDQPKSKNELHFASIRSGRNPGFHQIVFDSFADEIKLSHQAHNRSGFAQGALLAAEFIKTRKGMYSFDEVFERMVS